MQRLVGSGGAKLVLIIAPPGYGKSTLLAQWAEHEHRPVLWLEHAGRHVENSILHLPRLVRSLRSDQDGFVVVLDDAQLVAPAVLRRLVEAGLKQLPADSTIALSSRTQPAVPVGRLRANRALIEVRTQDLAMTSTEAATLLRHEKLELSPDAVETLVQRTEGWPAALYLAALSLRQDAGALDAFGGRNHFVLEYLRDETFAGFPAELRRLAMRASVLDELSGPICDVVLDRHGSGKLLEALARLTPLLLPVDSTHERYRWHALAGDALKAELRRSEPELEPDLHRRASGWYAARGDTQLAIRHAAASSDAELLSDLLWENIVAYITEGRNPLVQTWLSALGPQQIEQHAPLAAAASLSALAAGDVHGARRWSSAAAAAMERRRPGPRRRSLAACLNLVEAMSTSDGASVMGELASTVAATEPRNGQWRPLCLLLSGVSAHLSGNRDDAEQMLDAGSALGANAAPSLSALCLAQRSMVAMEQKDWQLATELTDRAIVMLGEFGLGDDPLCAMVYAATAAACAHQGRVDEAKAHVRSSMELLATLGEFVPWYGASARILLAHASLWLTDVVRARTLLAEASRFARKTPDTGAFRQWFDDAWAYADTLAESSLAGPSSLTIAELRILRFLPSHRSFRQIAEQLGVSTNTVKTQAHAVYRKLGAASRSEAVAHAVAVGLLGQ